MLFDTTPEVKHRHDLLAVTTSRSITGELPLTADELALEGLAGKWEEVKEIRKRMLKTGKLLVWEEPKKDPVIRKLFGVMNHYFEVQPLWGEAEAGEEGEEEECKEEDDEVDPDRIDFYYRNFVPSDETLAGDADPDDKELYDMLSGALVAAPDTQVTDASTVKAEVIDLEEETTPPPPHPPLRKLAVFGSDPRLARLEQLRPLTAKQEAAPTLDVETQPMDLSPVARDLAKQFQAVAADDSPDAKQFQAVAADESPDAKVDCPPEPSPCCDATATDAKTAAPENAAKDDLFHFSDPDLNRKAQFQANAALDSGSGGAMEETGGLGKVRGRPKGKGKAATQPKAESEQPKPKPKGKAKAKAKAKSAKAESDQPKPKPKGKAKAKAKAKSASKASAIKESDVQDKPDLADAPAGAGTGDLGAEPSAPKRKREVADGVPSSGHDRKKAKKEAVSKPKASAKTRAKARAKGKAAAEKPSQVDGEAANDEMPAEEEETAAVKVKATFASRACPNREAFAKQKFVCIRESFELYVKHLVTFPSSREDAYWKHCTEALSEEIKVLLAMSRLPAGLAVYAKHGLAQSAPGLLIDCEFICLVMCLMKLTILEELDYYHVLDFFAGKARSYPVKFAAKVVLGRRHLLAQQPVIRVSWQFQIFKAAVIGAPFQYSGLLAMLNSVPIQDTTWNDAELYAVNTYLYGSKHLHLPPELKQELKKEIAEPAEPLSEEALADLDDDELQILFWAKATSGDAVGLQAVKPEVLEEHTAQPVGVLPASAPEPPSFEAGLSQGSLGDTLLDPAPTEDAVATQLEVPAPESHHAAPPSPPQLAPPPRESQHAAPPGPLIATVNAGSNPRPLRTAARRAAPKSEPPAHVSSDSEDDFGVASLPPPELSVEAVKQRIRRIFTPRADGSYLVAADFVKQWADKSPQGGRDKLMALFEKTAYHRAGPVNKEQFIKRCKAIAEEVEEESFEIEGEFLTLLDMDNLGFSASKKEGIVRYCSTRPSLIRQSKYGEGDMYWTDVRIKGKLSKTKRKIVQEMMEWDEEASSKDEVKKKHKFDDWDLSKSDSGAFSALLDVEAEDEKVSDEQLAVDSGSIAKKVSWPEIAQDAAPSSLLHPCKKCVQRHEKKIDLLAERFVKDNPKLTALQEQLKTKLLTAQKDLSESVDTIEAKIKEGTLDGFTRGMNKEIKKMLSQMRQQSCTRVLFLEDFGCTLDEASSEDDVLLEHLAETMGDGAQAVSVKRAVRARCGKRPRASGEKNPERDAQRLFERSNLSLPIKIETTEHATADASLSVVKTYHVRPQSWVQFLLTECP
ncbi:unnamed protein product, partial [Symbiodinium microadriaticum]